MTPRRLTPKFLEKIWGVTRLEPWFPNTSEKTGEVWFEEDSPLLVKFLFTSDKLSVQVHPNDSYAREHHGGSRGKTEMWHVLAAEPGAKIAAGFREPLTPKRLREAALSGEIENLLEWHDAAPGDTFFIPAGTVHAIGAGLTLCEIQQNSDVTYRLYDYGRPRELHLDDAVTVSHLGAHPARQNPREDTLVSCEHFVTRRLRVDGSIHHQPPAGQFELLIVIEGSGHIAGQAVKAGEVYYVPEDSPPFELSGRFTLLRTGCGAV